MRAAFALLALSPRLHQRQVPAVMSTSDGRVRKRRAAGAAAKPAKPKPTYEAPRDADGRAYFYFRSEPLTRMVRGVDVKFSYDDLVNEPESTAHWDGVRNHVAKNWLRAMRVGDRGLFYHSNAGDDTGVVGVVEVVREAYADHTAFDKDDPHYDGRSSKEKPTWFMVDVKAVRLLPQPVLRTALKADAELAESYMIKQGRVSVGPVQPEHFVKILALADNE